MKRSLPVAAAVVAVGLCGLLGARYLLAAATRAAEGHFTRLAAEHGVVISGLVYRKAGYRWPSSIRWEGLSLQGRLAGRDTPPPLEAFTVSADSITATLESFEDRMISIAGDGLLFTAREGAPPADGSTFPRVETVSGSDLVVRAPIDFLRPRTATAQLRIVSEELGKLARTGTCALPVEFEGTVTFSFRGVTTAGIRVRQEGAESRLTIDENDLLALSVRLGLKLPLTRDEATLLARHPLRVPRLLVIRDEARARAEEERRRDDSFPEDAYRHLLWSYLLTATYGEQFASEVTGAHERGITGNTTAERLMDLSNNALGRWYAKIGVPAAALPDRARRDHRVIRTPREVAGKKLFAAE